LIRRKEKGFTLIELLVGLAITSVIIVAMCMTITTLVTNSQGTTERSTALRQVQNAGYSISHDVQMAKTVTPDGTSGFPLTLDIPIDTDENNDYRYIDVAETTFIDLGLNTYELTIRASTGEAVTERSYQIEQRLSYT